MVTKTGKGKRGAATECGSPLLSCGRSTALFSLPAALVSRQFVDMSRIRIEGLLAAFPKLVGTGKQHTYVETENVRYLYQPIEVRRRRPKQRPARSCRRSATASLWVGPHSVCCAALGSLRMLPLRPL